MLQQKPKRQKGDIRNIKTVPADKKAQIKKSWRTEHHTRNTKRHTTREKVSHFIIL